MRPEPPVAAAGSTHAQQQQAATLIPGVLHAYKASADDLSGYMAPVPEPGTCALLLAGLLGVGAAARCGLEPTRRLERAPGCLIRANTRA